MEYLVFIPLVWLLVWAMQKQPKTKSLGDYKPVEKHVKLRITESENCHVEDVGYMQGVEQYHCLIVCPKLDLKIPVLADEVWDLEDEIRKWFDYCEQRIRDKKNQYYIRKLRRENRGLRISPNLDKNYHLSPS